MTTLSFPEHIRGLFRVFSEEGKNILFPLRSFGLFISECKEDSKLSAPRKWVYIPTPAMSFIARRSASVADEKTLERT
jgi:hypothetical protein